MRDDRASLWSVIDARDATVERLREELAQREAMLRTQDEALQRLGREMLEKEAVIRELDEAVSAFRQFFGRFGFVLRPAARIVKGWRRLRRAVGPRLGVLEQYDPRPLRIPPEYARTAAPDGAPSICVVTPSFRQGHFIERTIASVVEQGYPRLEYFVQDGGSDDGTKEVLRRWAPRIAGWESRPDSGQSEAINRGFARVSGDIMAWLNSDDLLLPGTLAYVAGYFHRHPEVDVIYSHRILIDEEDREIGRWILPAHDERVLSWVDFVPQETLFWRRAIWEKAGGSVDESFRFAMDWDLIVRLREAGARFARVPRFLGAFRVHAAQKTSSGISGVGYEEMDRIRERVLGRVPSRGEINRAVAPYMLRHLAIDLPRRVRAGLGMAS